MKLLFALPGFHRYERGAEVALLSVASELVNLGDDVTVIGAGQPKDEVSYEYRRLPAVPRERFEKLPSFPLFRNETAWEDATFAASLAARVPLTAYGATITCSFPFTHWALRKLGTRGPAHIFVTQNGDWPAYSNSSEYKLFHCDGLVCTNPDYYRRNSAHWPTELIPNGVDTLRFSPGSARRSQYGLPADRPVVLMVSAFIESKRVLDGIRAVSAVPDAFLAIAGDGPLRLEARKLAESLLPGRYAQLTVAAAEMPSLYRSADVFLHLSLLESFGNVFLEAWASGIPIVAHDSERLRWILGDEQYLCDSEQLDLVAALLRQAIVSGDRVGRSGVERFAWPAVAARYREFIAACIREEKVSD